MKKKNPNEKSEKSLSHMETMEELKALIRQHRVCWEVLPEQVPVKEDRPLKVGFDLILYGTHALGDHPVPGCEKCQQIFKDLRKIAQWIMPKVERPSRYEIEIFDSAIRYSPMRRKRPDVMLTIKILHRSEFNRPVDACEVLCLSEMKTKLIELGAPERSWREPEGVF
jgi:hypothetical protein